MREMMEQERIQQRRREANKNEDTDI